jgi:branched-chain amino acid transport system permease protein
MSLALPLAETVMSLEFIAQQVVIGLASGSLIALVALGYTMVYGVVGLVNFAHGDLFMLGGCLAVTLVEAAGPPQAGAPAAVGILLLVVLCGLFCGGLNLAVDRLVYRPLRESPKLAPLVSSIGVSFIFMNLGLFWIGPSDRSFPSLVPADNLLPFESLRFSSRDLLVVAVVVPLMAGLAVLVRSTRSGKAMRAVAQDPTAAALVGVNVEKVIGATFFLGGFLAGAASVVYAATITTIGFQMGFQTGLYAFTAAVLGGIGSIPGAVVGGLVIGLVRALGGACLGERWAGGIVFAVLIAVLVFRPEGLFGRRQREKV